MNKIVFAVTTLATIAPLAIFASNGGSRGWEDDSHRSMSRSGMMQGSGMVRPPMGTGAMMGSGVQMAREMQSLHMAMKQLSPADHAVLMKMVKDYLLSKGIDPAKYADMKSEMKDMKKEMKDARKNARDELKSKREEMKDKMKEMRESNRNR